MAFMHRYLSSITLALVLAGCSAQMVEVVDVSGRAVPGANVAAVSLSMALSRGTGADGKAELPSNPQGARWVEVTKTGYQRVETDLPATWPLQITFHRIGDATSRP